MPIHYSLMVSLPVDIKIMPIGFDDFKYLLVAICEITNLVLVIPIQTEAAKDITETLIHRVICPCGPPFLYS